jgi:hypothetical protein
MLAVNLVLLLLVNPCGSFTLHTSTCSSHGMQNFD